MRRTPPRWLPLLLAPVGGIPLSPEARRGMVPSNDPDQIASNVTVTQPTTLDKIHGLADAVRNYDADPAYAGEARHVRRYGSMEELIKHHDEVADVINAASAFFTPETAPAAGVELTADDLSALANRTDAQVSTATIATTSITATAITTPPPPPRSPPPTDAQGRVVSIEASKAGAFEGDMLGQADTAGHPRPAGALWTGARVKYCFGEDASAGTRRAFYGAVDQVRTAASRDCISGLHLGIASRGRISAASPLYLRCISMAQVRQAVPCIAFAEVGRKGAACEHAAEEKSVHLRKSATTTTTNATTTARSAGDGHLLDERGLLVARRDGRPLTAPQPGRRVRDYRQRGA